MASITVPAVFHNGKKAMLATELAPDEAGYVDRYMIHVSHGYTLIASGTTVFAAAHPRSKYFNATLKRVNGYKPTFVYTCPPNEKIPGTRKSSIQVTLA